MSSQFNMAKFMFGDALDDNTLAQLGNIDGMINLGMDMDEKMSDRQEVSQDAPSLDKKESMESVMEVSGEDSGKEERKSSDNFSIAESSESEDDDLEELEQPTPEPKSSLQTIQRESRVRFAQEERKQEIDLPMLIRKKNEIVYQLTSLYVPKYDNQKKKMIEFNKEKMHHFNHDENEGMRKQKRKLKEELKQNAITQKIKHQIQFCDPSPLLTDALYLYTPGMNSKQLQVTKERKYQNITHIGKVVPSKRTFQQANLDKKAAPSLPEPAHKKPELELKQYVVEDKFGINSVSMINDWEKKIQEVNQPRDPETIKAIEEEEQYQNIYHKMRDNDGDMSIADLSPEERAIVKAYLKRASKQLTNSCYTQGPDMTEIQRDSFQFMMNLNFKDFSYLNQKSAFQSNDQAFLYDDPQPFGLSQGHTREDNLSNLSEPNSLLNNSFFESLGQRNQQQPEKVNMNSFQLYEKVVEQRLRQGDNQRPAQRRKYWGELTDCVSKSQLALDNYLFEKAKGKQEKTKKNLFRCEKVSESAPKDKKNKQAQPPPQQQTNLATDIRDYEFLKKQEGFFYEEGGNEINVNSIMRRIQFSLGLISSAEFYEQEALADQLEQQEQIDKGVFSKGKERHFEVQAKKEKACLDMVDNYDYHYERRKRQLQDQLMKKIQNQEKQNQQHSATQQTEAYKTGTHALLQVSSALEKPQDDKDKHSLVNMSKIGDGHWNQNEEESGADEEMRGHLHEGVIMEENHLSRVTKNKANELNHAKCILKLTYTKFDWSGSELIRFHRSNIEEVFSKLKLERQLEVQNMQSMRGNSAFPRSSGQIVIDFSGARINESRPVGGVEEVVYVSLPVAAINHDYIEKRFKKIGIINTNEYFKDRFKLSLRDGKFCLFEHIDQHPLFINNFGMASKLKRYVYSDHILPQQAFLRRGDNFSTRHMGSHGAQVLKGKLEKIPLLGQIDTKTIRGITVMENNMYYCPTFAHKPTRNDFLCVIHNDKKGQNQIIVRDIQDLYVMGQQEPKMEVYNPQSRQYQHFIKRRTQAYVIRFLQENHNSISFSELNSYFAYINDQILKKIIKEINVEVDRNQFCSLVQEYTDEQFKQLITPENICQYESAQFGEQMLKNIGVREITNADKISYATNKFCSEESNIKKQKIARLIEEAVLSTPWNLSQNFIHNKQTKGMMMLEGIGDPSNGNGGYSYLKLPLKISQDSLNKAKVNRMYLNPAIQNPKAVTGTDADLRKLSKDDIKKKLIEFGYKDKDIQTFTRWQMVAILREHSCQAVQLGKEGDMKKFARGVRFTSKKQREMYQKQVNDIFKKQINYLSSENPGFINDASCDEDNAVEARLSKRINDSQQNNSNYNKNIVEVEEDIEINVISDIPNYEVLIMASQPLSQQLGGNQNQGTGLNIGGNSGANQGPLDLTAGNIEPAMAKEALEKRLQEGGSLRCTILRKKIMKYVEEGEPEQIEKIVFCSDPRQIKGFNKRKHKNEVKTSRNKKTSLKEKMQLQQANLDDLKVGVNRSANSSVIKHPHRMTLANSGSNTIKIGGFGMGDSQSFVDSQSEYKHHYKQQTSSISIPIGGAHQSSRNQLGKSTFSGRLRTMHSVDYQYDNASISSSNYEERLPAQKISISLNMGQTQKKEKSSKPSRPKINPSGYNDEDFEIQKQKIQPTRRRQATAENMLNEIFGNVIDNCICFDTTKLFAQKVSRKDAPNYYEVIKFPMDLTSMKNKTKRNDYSNQEEFLADLQQIKENAEIYNGPTNHIAQLARDLQAYGEKKLNEVANDIQNLEMLVKEQKESQMKI